MPSITIKDIFEAKKRITPYILQTPVELSQQLLQDLGTNVHLKLENL
jgi:threonine dehydratase